MGGTVGNAHLAAGADIQKTFQGTGSGRKNALGRVQLPGGISPASGKAAAASPTAVASRNWRRELPAMEGTAAEEEGAEAGGTFFFWAGICWRTLVNQR